MDTKYEKFYAMDISFFGKINLFLIRVHGGASLSNASEVVTQQILKMKILEAWVPSALISARVQNQKSCILFQW